MPSPKPGMELAALVELYAAERLPSPKTIRNQKTVARLFARDTGITHTADITKGALLQWRDEILARASRTTWNTYLREMRTLLNFAVSTGRVNHNPFLEVGSLRTAYRRKKTVDGDLLHHAISVLTSPNNPLNPGWFWTIVVRTFYYTGMRRRQLVHLRWSHANLDEGVLRLMAEGSKTRREWDIPLVPNLVDDLRVLRDRTVAMCGSEISELQIFNACLFNTRYRGPETTEEQVSGFFRRLSGIVSREQGRPIRITPHRLRHTMATHVAAQGDIKSLQTILGHTDARMTMEYIQPDITTMRSMLCALPRL